MLKSYCQILNHAPIYRVFQIRTVVLSYKTPIALEDGAVDPELSPVLVFHGLLGSKNHWEGLGKTINTITKRLVVIADVRNHGDSPHVNSHTYPELAGDAIELLDKLAIKKAVMMGHSMGGKIAMAVALMTPSRVPGLVVVDISPVSTARELSKGVTLILKAMKTVKFNNPRSLRAAKDDVKKQLRSSITDEMTLRIVLSNIRMRPDKSIGWCVNLDTLIQSFDQISSFPQSLLSVKYSGPAIFIGGQHSDFLPPDDLNPIRAIFPQAVIHYIPKAGHMLHYDDPKKFLELAIGFMKTCK